MKAFVHSLQKQVMVDSLEIFMRELDYMHNVHLMYTDWVTGDLKIAMYANSALVKLPCFCQHRILFQPFYCVQSNLMIAKTVTRHIISCHD